MSEVMNIQVIKFDEEIGCRDNRAFDRAMKYINEYMKRYNPAGYNTEVESIIKKGEPGKQYYEITITRWSCCD